MFDARLLLALFLGICLLVILIPPQVCDPGLEQRDLEAAAADGRTTVTAADLARFSDWQLQFGNEAH